MPIAVEAREASDCSSRQAGKERWRWKCCRERRDFLLTSSRMARMMESTGNQVGRSEHGGKGLAT
jgi:hypothetical protein